MELQEFGPVAQSKALFNEATSSNLQAYKLMNIAAILLIAGFAVGYVHWQQKNIQLIQPKGSKE